MPFLERCMYCDVEYDVIGKSETFDDDLRFVAQAKGVDELLDTLGEKLNSNAPESGTGETERTKKYFDELTRSEKEKVLEMYRIELEMFGYDAEPYMQ